MPDRVIKGRSTSSSIVRPPSCDQIRSYSRRASVVGRMRRPLDAQMPEIVETDVDGVAGLIEGHVQIDAQARDRRLLHRRRGAGRQRRQPLFRFRQCAAQELAFGSVQLQREGQLTLPPPAILGQQGRAGRSDKRAPRRRPQTPWRAGPLSG